MNIYTLNNRQVEKELGQRLRALRLRRNLTQQELANSTTLSISTIKALEAGKGKLSSLIAVLRALNALEAFNDFIPEITVSPIQLAKMKGKKRQRASGQRKKDKDRW